MADFNVAEGENNYYPDAMVNSSPSARVSAIQIYGAQHRRRHIDAGRIKLYVRDWGDFLRAYSAKRAISRSDAAREGAFRVITRRELFRARGSTKQRRPTGEFKFH